MRIAVISPDYPTENTFAYFFVHNRLKLYKEQGHEVKVFNIAKKSYTYTFENIDVQKDRKDELRKAILQFSPDVLAVHFPVYYITKFINTLPFPKVVWLHGNDILWRFRLKTARNFLVTLKKYLVLIPRQGYQVYLLKKYLPTYKNCIFVSQGFLDKAEKQTGKRFPNALVISNPIDVEKFKYTKPQFNKVGISLRSFANNIYGFDIAIKALKDVERTRLDLIGRGRLKDKFEKLIKEYNSACKIIEKHVEHNDIPKLYQEYCFFAAPSRMDTQGLAMCEAMACGLPAIGTKVGGIPDYVIDGYNGYLVEPNNPTAFREAIEKLISNEDRYYEMSMNARKLMEEKCSSKVVVEKELEVLEKAIKN